MEEMNKIANIEFALSQITVICSMCENLFATQYIEKMEDISVNSRIEADLHRVIDEGNIRSALLAMCPACLHTGWPDVPNHQCPVLHTSRQSYCTSSEERRL